MTGTHVLVALVLFFGVVIAVNITLAVLANTSWTGLVVENGYVASQEFNRDLAEARREAAMGWSEEFGYHEGLITLTLRDKDERPLTGATVVVKLERPSTDREDQTITLAETRTGFYSARIALRSGLWDADVTARAATDRLLRRVYRLTVSDGSPS
jgi:nitrogen fixation protein FixH